MVTIGITGPTGCGKTTLLQEIAARGGEIVDCDALYYELLKTDPDLKAALAAAFGEIFLPDGSLDRPLRCNCLRFRAKRCPHAAHHGARQPDRARRKSEDRRAEAG